MELEVHVKNIRAGYGDGPDILHDVSLSARAGHVTTLIGPNGCGKSTLLKTMSKLLRPRSGEVHIGNTELHSLGTREAATHIAVLPQHPSAPAGLRVGELVARGRHPHQSRLRGLNKADHEAIINACECAQVADLIDREIGSLSGGQRQRVWFAMTLAQDTPVLLLDEPTTFMDPAHSIEMLELARDQAQTGKAVVMVLHDLMLAGRYSDSLIIMKEGQIVIADTPIKALTPEILASVYGLRAEVWTDPDSKTPIVVPKGVFYD